jgi:hypothetical protein
VLVGRRRGRCGGLQQGDLHRLHHAAVLVRQDVAVDHEISGVIDEAAAHLEVSGNDDPVSILIGGRQARRNGEDIPPDARRWKRWGRRTRLPGRVVVRVEITLARLWVGRGDVLRNGFAINSDRRVRIENLYDLKWIHVDVERVRDSGRRVRDLPFFNGVQKHWLSIVVAVELLSVDRMLGVLRYPAWAEIGAA